LLDSMIRGRPCRPKQHYTKFGSFWI